MCLEYDLRWGDYRLESFQLVQRASICPLYCSRGGSKIRTEVRVKYNGSYSGFSYKYKGWSGGAMVLGKLPVLGHPTNLDNGGARAYCACSRCGRGLFGHFFSLIYQFSFLSPSLCETARYRLKCCLKGPLNPKQPTNQLISMYTCHIGTKY